MPSRPLFQPTVSVIIPVEPEGRVEPVLERLRTLDYPAEKIEVLVAEGRLPSRQRNLAVTAARGEILYFLDSDSFVTPGLFGECLPLYEDERVAIVGGPNLCPEDAALIQRLFDAAQGSWFGSYLVRSRYRRVGVLRETSEKELILCNLSFRRSAFERFEGFDERLYPNEENELMNRIKGAGLKLLYQPTAVVYRRRRESLRQFVVQNFRYGRGRMEQMLLNLFPSDLVHFVPAVFLLYLLSLAAWRPLWWAAPALAYGALCAGTALAEAVRARQPLWVPLLPAVFVIRHLAYGAGLWGGAARTVALGARLHPPGSEGHTPVIKKVKALDAPWPS